MTALNQLKDNEGARKSRMRVGRGEGSGKGKTCGRGHKGQKSRSGPKINGYEGGQMPFYQRLPKRGFNNPNARKYAIINLDRLQEAFDAGKLDTSKPVTESVLVESGVVTKLCDGVRLLGRGKFTAKATLEISGASKSAVAAVEKAGGKVNLTQQKQEKTGKKTEKKAQVKEETPKANEAN